MDEDNIEWPLPEWATGRTTDYMTVGAQLLTRDGRRSGNACVIAVGVVEYHNLGVTYEAARVLTDAGNSMTLTRRELEELYYEPNYTMDPLTCPGIRK